VDLVLVERPAVGDVERLLVLLPGFGDEPSMFTDHLGSIDPERRWQAAVARPPLDTPDGPAWFTVGPDGPDPDELATSASALGDAISALLERFALGPERLVLGGFSQGGAMALAVALDPTVAARPGAVASLGAYLPHRDLDQNPALLAGRPVLVAHGADDEVVDALLGRSTAKALHRAGALVTWEEVPGGHVAAGPLLDALGGWLGALADGSLTPHPPT
jgi:phospholipase/carboxylesterase